jgi:hypothetical protein
VDEQDDEFLIVLDDLIARGQGFRAVMAEAFGQASPDPNDAPEVWVAWFLDARWEDGLEVYDVDDGPVEDDCWPRGPEPD